MSNTRTFSDFDSPDSGTTDGTNEAGVLTTDTLEKWREKTNGIIEKVKYIDTHGARLNSLEVQRFESAVGGEFEDYGAMSASNRTIDLEDANSFKFSLEGNYTTQALVLDNLAGSAGCSYTLIIESKGDHEITWPSVLKFVSGGDVLSTTGSSETPTYDILRFESDGTNLYGVIDSARRSITVQHDGTDVTDIQGCTISRTSAGQYTITVPDSGTEPTAVASLAIDWSTSNGFGDDNTLTSQYAISARTTSNTEIIVECVNLTSSNVYGGGNDGNEVAMFKRVNVDTPFQVIIAN